MMRKLLPWALTAVIWMAAVGCDPQEQDLDSTYDFGPQIAFRLPPGHPGTVTGNIFVIPAQTTGPAVHAANCFAGVENDMEIGIGSALGYTPEYIGAAVLPVNVNLGARQLGHFKITVTSASPAIVDFDVSTNGVIGSVSQLSNPDCTVRGCPISCQSSGLYPAQFNRAPGFEHVDNVASGVGWVTVETANDSTDPTTGVVNICNIRIRVLDTLPGAGVNLTFTVESLDDSTLTDISAGAVPINGIVIEQYQLQ